MQSPTPPMARAVEVVAAEPTDADRASITHLSARDNKSLSPVAYVVKVRFETMPPATSQGWALYVNDVRIPKYWAYGEGVYFKVFDPKFFEDHAWQSLRFSLNGTDFIDTGLKLPAPSSDARRSAAATKLPLQDDVLSTSDQPHKRVRAKKARPKTKVKAAPNRGR
jgi:hypothetical protein